MQSTIRLREMTVDFSMPEGASAPAAAVLHGLHLLLQKDMKAFVQMFATDAVVEYPFAPDGWPQRLSGHHELIGHLHDYPDHLDIRRLRDVTIYNTSDPDTVIAEFAIEGLVTSTQHPYEVKYIEVVSVHHGLFKKYKDYWNPLLALSLVPQGLGH